MIRSVAPATNNKYYVSVAHGGYNKCIIINPETGSVLPNCTGYAYGRFMEMAEVDECRLSTADAERWYNADDGYTRGQVAKVGAVACWSTGNAYNGTDGHGHVAIVEEVNPDGTILISQSGYYSKKFTTQYIAPPYVINGQTFQGFIYNPFLVDDKIKSYGVDLSQHNPYDTDITQYDFVIIRATWGDHLDDKAIYWRDKCDQLNIPYGVYCYSYSLYPEQARQEAQYLVDTIKAWNVRVGVWLDMEDADGYKAKNGVTSAEQWTDIVNAFCEVVQANDYYTGIYANYNDFTNRIHTTKYDRWVASWGTNDGTVQRDTEELGTMLQYSSYGGIDRDLTYVELSHYTPNAPVFAPVQNNNEGDTMQEEKPDIVIEDAPNGYLFQMSDKTYDALAFIANMIPLVIVLYVALANTWGIPYTDKIVATISAFGVFLNSVLKQSTIGYQRALNKDD